MRVLVTGAAGFVGSHVCDALLARGHELLALGVIAIFSQRLLAGPRGDFAAR